MNEQEVLELYFRLGFSQKEILYLLAHFNAIIMSRRTLQRRLSAYRLFRRKGKTDILDVALFMVQVLDSSGEMLGYRLMHLKCIQEGLTVTQNDVRLLMHLLDPEGIDLRSRRRLKRRKYYSRGPNFTWHFDSYDKLKPYGICINGAIDGFSRSVIWLQAYHTSSDPSLIAHYYVDAVKSKQGCPQYLRCDFGTENGHVRDMHNFLLEQNGQAPANAVILGSSNHNQRIEAWWAFLRKSMSNFWMKYFLGLKEEALFSGDLLDRNLIQFCFSKLIQVK